MDLLCRVHDRPRALRLMHETVSNCYFDFCVNVKKVLLFFVMHEQAQYINVIWLCNEV